MPLRLGWRLRPAAAPGRPTPPPRLSPTAPTPSKSAPPTKPATSTRPPPPAPSPSTPSPPTPRSAPVPRGRPTTRPPSFEFSSEPGASLQCSLDGAAFSACTSPKAYTSLADGPHSFEVRATDQAGNVDPTPAARSFTVDTQAPETTISSGPSGPTNDPAAELRILLRARRRAAVQPRRRRLQRLHLAAGLHLPRRRPPQLRSAGDRPGRQRRPDPRRPFLHGRHPGPRDDDQLRSLGPHERLHPDLRVLRRRSTPVPPGRSTPRPPPSNSPRSPAPRCSAASTAPPSAPAPRRSPTAPSPTAPTRFEVRAIDQAGNVDPTPAARSFTVDTQAPAAPSLTATSPASPANNNSPKVKGSAEAGSVVRIYSTVRLQR